MLIKGFEKDIIKNDGVYVVALSGGMDSICLMENVLEISKNKNIKVHAIHVNHHIRGKEADRDEDFVKAYASEKNIDLMLADVDAVKCAKEKHMSLEESARTLRYLAFYGYIDKLNKKYKKEVYLLVAHHKQDQTETVIHNILRGTGIAGLKGMDVENRMILRPMLNCDKKDIEKYIYSNNISFVEDSTNEDNNYTRNYIRNVIVPHLEKVNKKALEHIIDLSKDAEEIDAYLKDASKRVIEEIVCDIDKKNKKVTIDNKKFKKYGHIIKIYVLRGLLQVMNIPLKDITRTNLDDIIDLSIKTKGGHLDMPYNVTIDKKSDKLIFTINKENISMKRKRKK